MGHALADNLVEGEQGPVGAQDGPLRGGHSPAGVQKRTEHAVWKLG